MTITEKLIYSEEIEKRNRERIAKFLKGADLPLAACFNPRLSLKGCWKMVNKIQEAGTPEGIRARCRVAEEWLRANEVISTEEYDELMRAVSWLHRESYHMDGLSA